MGTKISYHILFCNIIQATISKKKNITPRNSSKVIVTTLKKNEKEEILKI